MAVRAASQLHSSQHDSERASMDRKELSPLRKLPNPDDVCRSATESRCYRPGRALHASAARCERWVRAACGAMRLSAQHAGPGILLLGDRAALALVLRAAEARTWRRHYCA